MTLPLGQHYAIVDGASPFNCDVSTNPTVGRYIATSVGGVGQSTICWECAEAIYELVKNTKRRVPTGGKLRVETMA